MKKFSLPVLMLALITTLSSCHIVGGIFKAGFYAGIFAVIIIVAIIIYIILKFRGGNNGN